MDHEEVRRKSNFPNSAYWYDYDLKTTRIYAVLKFSQKMSSSLSPLSERNIFSRSHKIFKVRCIKYSIHVIDLCFMSFNL